MTQALRTIIICPDQVMARGLEESLAMTPGLSVVRTVGRYMNSIELTLMLQSHDPQVVLLSAESAQKAMWTASEVEQIAPGVQVVAVGRTCTPETLTELMESGIREYLAAPLEPKSLDNCVNRLNLYLTHGLTALWAGRAHV